MVDVFLYKSAEPAVGGHCYRIGMGLVVEVGTGKVFLYKLVDLLEV